MEEEGHYFFKLKVSTKPQVLGKGKESHTGAEKKWRERRERKDCE